MNLDKAYRVTLRNKRDRLVQYIEADDMDKAINLARNSFHARLEGLDTCKGSDCQKACNRTILHERLRFGFNGGWTTLDCEGMNIFDALEKASKHEFLNDRGEISEIYSPTF